MGGGSDIVRFHDQIMTEMKSMAGDSGSLVLSEDNYAIGLLFAGSNDYTVLNPIGVVLDKLGVDLV